MQDKTAIERGIFDKEVVPEELTQVRMGKIVRDKYPGADRRGPGGGAPACHRGAQSDAEGGSRPRARRSDGERQGNTALIDGVRKFVLSVPELDIDLIDRINPFGAAYAILAKGMNSGRLKQVEAAIAAKRTSLTLEEARELAARAVSSRRSGAGSPRSVRPTLGRNAWPKGGRVRALQG